MGKDPQGLRGGISLIFLEQKTPADIMIIRRELLHLWG